MAVQIISGASSSLLTVDAVSNAARASLYDTSGNPMGDISSLGNNLGALNANATLTLAGHSTFSVDVEGTTGTLTLLIEGTINGTNWETLPMIPAAGGAAVTSTTANGQWLVSVAGFQQVRARISAFTSGSMTVSVTASPATSPANSFAQNLGTVGATAAVIAALIGGSDGTNLRALSVDSSGRPNVNIVSGGVSYAGVSGVSATAPSIPSQIAQIGGIDNTGNLQALVLQLRNNYNRTLTFDEDANSTLTEMLIVLQDIRDSLRMMASPDSPDDSETDR